MSTERLRSLYLDLAGAGTGIRAMVAKLPDGDTSFDDEASTDSIRAEMSRIGSDVDEVARQCAWINATVTAVKRLLDEMKSAEVNADPTKCGPTSPAHPSYRRPAPGSDPNDPEHISGSSGYSRGG